jgi:hypothetical protein
VDLFVELSPESGQRQPMIVIITSHAQIRQTLTREFDERAVAYRVFDSASELALSGLYSSGVRAAIVDARISALAQSAWLDIVGSLGRRIPVFVLGHFVGDDRSLHARTSDLIGWHDAGDPVGLLALLESSGVLAADGEKKSSFGIPVYNPQNRDRVRGGDLPETSGSIS